jgi:hypothetical protein
VRNDVLKTTRNRQEPFKYGSLGGTEIALVPAKPLLPEAVTPPKPTIDYDKEMEITFWLDACRIHHVHAAHAGYPRRAQWIWRDRREVAAAQYARGLCAVRGFDCGRWRGRQQPLNDGSSQTLADPRT